MSTMISRVTSTDRRFYGVAEALVVDVVDPDHECRVRVRLPWFDDGNGEVRVWCRICNLLAGNGYGSTVTPEVGDEVLVAFIHGDMRIPIVLGGLYNGTDKPANPRTTDTNQKTLRTKAGHQLMLDDSPASLGVEVRTSGGHRLHLDDVANQITVAISGGPSLVMSQSGSTMELKATSITLDATTISLKASTLIEANRRLIKLNS